MRVAVTAVLVVLASHAAAQGPVFHVNTTADGPETVLDGVCDGPNHDGTCTLRGAIMEANQAAIPAGDEATIYVPAGTYLLTQAIAEPRDDRNGDLNVAQHVRIVGAGAGFLPGPATIIDANHLDRVFFVQPEGELTLEDVRLQGGRPPLDAALPELAHGGGVYNAGILRLRRCLVRDHVSERNGGGIYSVGELTVEDSTVRVCSGQLGGGIFTGPARISRTTINSNTGTRGAGIYAANASGAVELTNDTIADNFSSGWGGGLYVALGTSARLQNVTVTKNTSSVSSYGGGIHLESGVGGKVFVTNSIVSTNTGRDIRCESGTAAVGDGRSFANDVACSDVEGSFSVGDPMLLPLALNGSPLYTSALAPGSPAVDAGDPEGCRDAAGELLTTDQRGVARPLGAACDLGAFESEPIGDANGDGAVAVLDVFYAINYLFAGGPVPKGRADVNGDSTITVNDVFYLINFLFAGGPAPQ